MHRYHSFVIDSLEGVLVAVSVVKRWRCRETKSEYMDCPPGGKMWPL